MGNCLVTKLKGVVDNDSLKGLGEYKLRVHVESGHTLTISLYGGAWDYRTTEAGVTRNENNQLVCPPGDYTIFLKDKYNGFTYINANYNESAYCVFSTDDLKYSTLLKLLIPFEGNLEDLDFSSVDNIGYIHPWYSGISSYIADVYGSINSLHGLEQINMQDSAAYLTGDLQTFVANNPQCSNMILTSSITSVINITGTITDLIPIAVLNNIGFRGTKVRGNIEDLAVGLFNGGRRSGDLNIQGFGWASFNGAIVQDSAGITCTFGADSIIAKKNNVTLATYDGTSWTYA